MSVRVRARSHAGLARCSASVILIPRGGLADPGSAVAGCWPWVAEAGDPEGGRVARRKQKPAGWMVVQTHQFSEFDARRALSHQGFEVAMPMMRLPRNRLGVAKTVPLFEGYVFVRKCEDWWSIRGTRGVSHVLMSCDHPSLIADDEMRFFTDVSVDLHGYYTDSVMPILRVGELVVPRSGRLAGIQVRLTELSRDGRCEYLFSMMGREVRAKGQVAELA